MALVRKAPTAKFEDAPAAQPAAAPTVAAEDNPAVGSDPGPDPVAQKPAPSVGVGRPAAGHPTGGLVRHSSNAGAVSTPARRMEPVLTELKNVVFVDFDTFPRLKAGPGQILDNEGKSLGTQIELTLVSWQDGWDLSPGTDSEEAKKHVAYSDDGITVKGTGMACTQYLEELRGLGYPDAKMTQKCTLVGILDAAEKDSPYLGQTVQVSLSNQARKTFDRYRMDRSIQIQMGKASSEGAEHLNIKAELRKHGSKDWTLLNVTGATA